MLTAKINYNGDEYYDAIREAAAFVALQPPDCSLEVVVYDNGDLYLGERYNGEYMYYNDEQGEHLVDTWRCEGCDEAYYEDDQICILNDIIGSIDGYVAEHNAQMDTLPYYAVVDGDVICAASTQDEIDYYMDDRGVEDYEVVSR